MNLSEEVGITIDAATSRDLDDALWCETDSAGNHRVTVYITDLSEIVAVGSDLDAQARERAASKYKGGYCFNPMLSGKVEEKGSLLPECGRRAIAVRLDFNKNYKFIDSSIEPVAFRSLTRLTYEQAAALALDENNLEIADLPPEFCLLKTLGAIGKSLHEQRRREGALSALFIQDGWEITEDMTVVKLAENKRNIRYLTIMELAEGQVGLKKPSQSLLTVKLN